MRRLPWILAIGLIVLLLWRAQKLDVVTANAGKPFVEGMNEATLLRPWITDSFPPGTKLLGYEHDDVWDGTVCDVWALHNPVGFDVFKRPNAQRTVQEFISDQAYSETAYTVLQSHLRQYGFRVEGERSPDLWRVEWKTEAKNTQIDGTIYPHTHGEVLLIQRITLK